MTEPARPRRNQPAADPPVKPAAAPVAPTPGPRDPGGLVDRVADLVEDAMGGVAGRMEDAARSAVDRLEEQPGIRARRLRRRGRRPLPSLYAVHPEARAASPRELGVQTIDIDRIHGTAIGGPTQRGADFLPLRPFRGKNWQARWQRIRQGMDRLVSLPPIDVVRFGDDFWVTDGHNRVAAAHYGGQRAIDANIVELVPSGHATSERPTHLAGVLRGSRALRTAGKGRRVGTFRDEDLDSSGDPS